MFREEIKVLDCTIRDGGLINNHYFTDEFVRAVYEALSKAGIDYMEMGYRSSRKYAPPSDYGDWKYCDDDKIRKIIDGVESDVKLSIMVDAHRIVEQEFAPVDQSPVDMIRVATYVKDIDKAIAMVNQVHDLGYETTVNVMAISKENEFDLIEALDQLAKTPVDTVYVVDSYGYYFCENICRKNVSAFTATTTSSWPLPILSRVSDSTATSLTARCSASAEVPETARWSC